MHLLISKCACTTANIITQLLPVLTFANLLLCLSRYCFMSKTFRLAFLSAFRCRKEVKPLKRRPTLQSTQISYCDTQTKLQVPSSNGHHSNNNKEKLSVCNGHQSNGKQQVSVSSDHHSNDKQQHPVSDNNRNNIKEQLSVFAETSLDEGAHNDRML